MSDLNTNFVDSERVKRYIEQGPPAFAPGHGGMLQMIGVLLAGHRQLVELRLRWCVTGTACSWLRRSGDAGDLGPSLEGLAPGGSILGGRHLMAAKVEEVADPVVGGQEALRLAG